MPTDKPKGADGRADQGTANDQPIVPIRRDLHAKGGGVMPFVVVVSRQRVSVQDFTSDCNGVMLAG